MMATKTIDRSPPTAPAPSRSYKDDLFGWVEDQVALLKAGQLSEVDAANIAEELSDVGGEQYDKLENAVRVVLVHLLKWDYQSERRSRSWVLSIGEHRRRIARVLKKNPSSKASIDEAVDDAYEDAGGDAIRETALTADTFPTICPCIWDDILNRMVAFDDTQSPDR
jgi:Domain of unknown function DUF29